MSDKERIDYLMIMVAELIQLNIKERHELGRFGAQGVFCSLMDMRDSLKEQDCVSDYYLDKALKEKDYE